MLKEQIKKDISKILNKYCYEKNDNDTRQNVIDDVTKYMTIVKESKKISDFKVICDNTINDKNTIEQNKLICQIAYKRFSKDKYFKVLECIIERD